MFRQLAKSKDTNKILLESYNYDDINQAKREPRFRNLKADEIYEILRNDFNTQIMKANELI